MELFNPKNFASLTGENENETGPEITQDDTSAAEKNKPDDLEERKAAQKKTINNLEKEVAKNEEKMKRAMADAETITEDQDDIEEEKKKEKTKEKSASDSEKTEKKEGDKKDKKDKKETKETKETKGTKEDKKDKEAKEKTADELEHERLKKEYEVLMLAKKNEELKKKIEDLKKEKEPKTESEYEKETKELEKKLKYYKEINSVEELKKKVKEAEEKIGDKSKILKDKISKNTSSGGSGWFNFLKGPFSNRMIGFALAALGVAIGAVPLLLAGGIAVVTPEQPIG